METIEKEMKRELREKCRIATIRFLKHGEGMKILDESFETDAGRCVIDVDSEGVLHFVTYGGKNSEVKVKPKPRADKRERLEEMAMAYLVVAGADLEEGGISFDEAFITQATSGKGLLRYRKNAHNL